MNELDRLRALMDAGTVKLGVHIRRVNSPGSPVYHAWENVWPAGTIVGTSFLGTLLVHHYLGMAILAVGAWWWLTKVHPRVKDGVFDRTAAYVLARERNMDALWGRGWLSLYAKLEDGREMAATQRESWRGFVGQVEAALQEKGSA